MSYGHLTTGKTRDALTAGLPSRIMLRLDWDAACDLTASRTNCIIHKALLRKEEITRPTVGLDKITFIWRGDARIEVRPDAHALRAILQNDEAAQGAREWPTGTQTLALPMDIIKVYDLRKTRVASRERARRPDVAKKHREWQASNPEALARYQTSYRGRQQKANKTKAERGRFILS